MARRGSRRAGAAARAQANLTVGSASARTETGAHRARTGRTAEHARRTAARAATEAYTDLRLRRAA